MSKDHDWDGEPYAPDPEANVGVENRHTRLVAAALDPELENIRDEELKPLVLRAFAGMTAGQREALLLHPYWSKIFIKAAFSGSADSELLGKQGKQAYLVTRRLLDEHTEDPMLDAMLRANAEKARKLRLGQ